MIFSLFKKKEEKWNYKYRASIGKYFNLTPEESQKGNYSGESNFKDVVDPYPDLGIRLAKGEKCYACFDDLSLKAYRRDGRVGAYGITLRKKVFKGVYLRAGTGRFAAPKSLQEVSNGSLYVTTKGIFFDGDRKNIKLPWSKIMKEDVGENHISLEPSNGEPILFNGNIDPDQAAIMTIVSQAHEHLE